MARIYYVDNAKLLHDLTKFKLAVAESAQNNVQRPVVPDPIALAIIKIADGLASKAKFANYPFVEEMKADGIKNCIEYIDNFDPKISQNPFAYFTQIIYFAFIRRIDKEKKYLYTKYKVIDHVNLGFDPSSDRHDCDSFDVSYNDAIRQSEGSIEYMRDFITNYENRKNRPPSPKFSGRRKK